MGNELWDKEDDIFEDFTGELADYTKTGKLPQSGDQDVRYYLELQKSRLKKRNIAMTYDITPRKDFAKIDKQCRRWSDGVYTNKMEWHPCSLIKCFSKDEKKLYKKEQKKIFYQYITYVKDGSDIGEELYTCPSCGAVSKIKELEEGCAYCGTRFEMDDLFPKVTNYFFVPDSGNEEESHAAMKKNIICSMIGMSVIMSIICLFTTNTIFDAVGIGIMTGVITGVPIGWGISVATLLFGVASQAKDTTGMLFNTIGSKGRFVNKMKKYSPEFSYEYFTGKVLSLLKMILYSEDVQELANYTGGQTGELYPDVIDSTYMGAVALKKFQVAGDYAEVDVEAYVENMYDKKSYVKRKVDKYRMHLRKNITVPIDYHFSIKKITCKNCAGSYDATKYKTCPGCGTKYEIGDDDWVVTSVERK